MEAEYNSTASAIVSEVLKGPENYANWRACMENYFSARDLWKVIGGNSRRSISEGRYERKMAWKRWNANALHAIQISCSPEMFFSIRSENSAAHAWDTLASICQKRSESPSDTDERDEEDEQLSDLQERSSLRSGESDYFQQIINLNPPSPSPSTRGRKSTDDQDEVVGRANVLGFLNAIGGSELETMKHQLNQNHGLTSSKVFQYADATPLCLAIMMGNLEMIDELLNCMSEEDIKMQDFKGRTVLHHVASYPDYTKLAQSLIRKNKELLNIPDRKGLTPLIYACEGGYKDMTHFLYNITTPTYLLSPDKELQASSVVSYCIKTELYEVALDLLRRCPKLALINPNKHTGNALLQLSRQPSAFLSSSGLSFWQRCIYSCLRVKQLEAMSSYEEVRINTQEQQDKKEIKNFKMQALGKLLGLWWSFLEFFGIKQIYDLKLRHLYAHELLILMSKTIAALDAKEIRQSSVVEAIAKASRRGMVEFVVGIIKNNRDLLMISDNPDHRTIFHIAIACRQEKLFSLIYGHEAMKYHFPTLTDNYDNNMLHLAANLFPEAQLKLDQISGAALQMQRELQWFKEVERLVPPGFKNIVNDDDETPSEAFNQSHAELLKEGEKWMKDIAQSSTIIGTLIITITFAALFTVPGGNNQDNGIPLFLTKNAFKVFAISDAFSLFASSTSVLMSIGMLTSRYSADDFLIVLPAKLIIGLSALFISIATMMLAFCSAIIIIFKGQLKIVIPIILLATVPICLFAWLQFPLLVEIFISTYGPRIFDRKIKKWF